jgi:hypothetical protein
MKWQAGKRAKAVKETELCIVQMDRVQHIATDESACLKVTTDAAISLLRARTESCLITVNAYFPDKLLIY